MAITELNPCLVNERGSTLIESIVSMVLLSTIGVFLWLSFQSLTGADRTGLRYDSLKESQFAIENLILSNQAAIVHRDTLISTASGRLLVRSIAVPNAEEGIIEYEAIAFAVRDTTRPLVTLKTKRWLK